MDKILRRNKKILVVGISGTGKSHISRKIAAVTELPLYHMDSIIWNEHWIEADTQTIHQALDEIAKTDSWIVEGWIDYYSASLVKQADVIIYLDFSGWLAMRGGLQRWLIFKGKKRPELPIGCDESVDLKYLYTMLMRLERPHIEVLLAKLKPKSVVRIRTRREANQLTI